MTDPRERLLEGFRVAIEEQGYLRTTIADIVRHAKASRRTFYQAYDTKDDCFLALMRASNEVLLQRVSEAVVFTDPWPEQARQAVEAYFAHVTAEPGVTLSWVRYLPAMGEAAQEVLRDSIDAVAALVQTLTDNEQYRAAGGERVSRELALMILGGLRELTATLLQEGRDVRDAQELAVRATQALLTPR